MNDAAIGWVTQTLATLTTEQKVRQLFNVPLHGEGPEDVARSAAMGVDGVTRFLGPDLTRSMAVARMPCVINAYTAIEPVQRAVLAKLMGEQPFTGVSPVDATCGLPDAMY